MSQTITKTYSDHVSSIHFCVTLSFTGGKLRDSLTKKTAVPLIAQMADIGFKVVLLKRLNQKWKQNHQQNPCNESKNRGGDHV